MASSVYESTSETTNANRACRAVLGPCTDGLRDTLRHYVPPQTLSHTIKQNRHKRPHLTAVQINLILPQNASYTGCYDDMDISLLYTLLRNIAGIPPHSKGWGNDPDPGDTSIAATIERIRLVRNQCVHSSCPSLSQADFVSIWSTVRTAMGNLDTFLNNGNKYEEDVDFLLHETMDPGRDSVLQNKLRKQVIEDQKTKDRVDKLEDKVKKFTMSTIPPNVKEQHNTEIQEWEEENKLYYETHSFPSMMEKVRNQSFVTFVGVPGSGKSATAHHIALKLQEEGYEVVPVDEIREIKQYCDTKNPQVFVIDDVVGVFGLQNTKFDVLTDYKRKLTTPCMEKSRTLMTCREAVFNEIQSYTHFFTEEVNVVRLHSSENELDENDKKQILQKYSLHVNLLSPSLPALTTRMFPLLCKFFSKENNFKVLGQTFFMNPIQCIIDEFGNMQSYNKLNYTTLVLCTMNGNCLSRDVFENACFVDKKRNLLEKCKLEAHTDTFKFMDALSAMEGTYTKQCIDGQYSFIHDSMYEICAYHFGTQFPDQILLHMSSSYIANFVKPQTIETSSTKSAKEQVETQTCKRDESSNGIVKEGDECDKNKESSNENGESGDGQDLCIRLREDQYALLADRLYRDIQTMELFGVFRNNVLKNTKVCEAFILELKTKSYKELESLFLCKVENVEKIMRIQKSVLDESEDWDQWSEERDRQRLLVDIRDLTTQGVRAISWVIYYGHNKILQYLVGLIQQHKEISELSMISKDGHEYSSLQNKDFLDAGATNRLPKYQPLHYDSALEQNRLLLLGCYSGDVETVKLILSQINKTPIEKTGQNGEGYVFCSPLTVACKGGHVSMVIELAKAGTNINQQDERGNTPLVVACEGGHFRVVEELVKAGVNVNLQDKWNSPLVAACSGGFENVVEVLVKAGACVNLKDENDKSPLICACYGGHVNVVKVLVKAGADVNLNHGNSKSALNVACCRGHVSIVKDLIKAGADVNLYFGNAKTPLITACFEGQVSVVKELVKAGSDANLQIENGNTALLTACKRGHASVVVELVKAGANVNQRGEFGRTPLIVACKREYIKVVEELMKAGADVNLQDGHGTTPLVTACEGGYIEVVEILLMTGADVNLQTREGMIPLVTACFWGHVNVVEKLVKAGACVNLQDKNGKTPLVRACYVGHVGMVEELVGAGVDVNLQDENGQTPLGTACIEGHIAVVEVLVRQGANVNLGNRGGTPLLSVIDLGHASILEMLVNSGADINLTNKRGETPLVTACFKGQLNVVEKLVKVGALVNEQNANGITPLGAACFEGHASLIEELVKMGANVNECYDKGRRTALSTACYRKHVSVIRKLVKTGVDVNIQYRNKETALVDTCNRGSLGVVEELLKSGADVNLKNGNGEAPLITASFRGHESIVKQLVQAGADVNLQNGLGKTSLVSACFGGHASVVDELLKSGANVNLQNGDGKTPLATASFKGHVNLVKTLIEAGADVNLENGLGETPLVSACFCGGDKVVDELVNLGADVNLQNGVGDIPLGAACLKGHAHVVEKLIQNGADVNLRNKKGFTPLETACCKGHFKVMEELVKAGVNVNLQGENGRTPLMTACFRGHGVLVRELLKAGADVNLRDGNGRSPLETAMDRRYMSIVDDLSLAGAN
ncbi:ankyrin repeat and KH domain-containing protein mask-like isoform X1 [Ostrea edulis]|uniref:ankyrin repeat and KH domain-containing protein mask-like isoform X1 n=2 Tax=Ostrea edulis TaxID=37623 RepID=UPI0024AEF726|nr:ankyrin repeat and KH domain-containing protein mask-like isoform X1 [Ostrea edulis]